MAVKEAKNKKNHRFSLTRIKPSEWQKPWTIYLKALKSVRKI
jgi:hypothetical protein